MTGAVKSRTSALGLALLRFDFPNWGDDMNKNQLIIDASYSIFGLTISGAWDNSTMYTSGVLVVDIDENSIYRCNVRRLHWERLQKIGLRTQLIGLLTIRTSSIAVTG